MTRYSRTMKDILIEMRTLYAPCDDCGNEVCTCVVEEVELDEAKYDLYHKDFSSAMQHAYAMAKKLHGITVDPKEIDDKVATGPKKPSKGKTNSYRLKGKGGAIQVQVANLDDKKFELNMYKEEVELDEDADKSLKKKADASGISLGILKKVFDRGVAAWKGGHRPGTTPVQWAHARVNSFISGGKTRTTGDADLWKQHKGKSEEVEVDEKFMSRRPSSKEVKMAIGIANDPRYKQGNYTGAVKAIEKIRDGLSDYPEVAAALRKANENLEEGKMKDLLIKAQDLMGPSKNREQGIEFVMKGLKVSKKEATKLVDAVIKMSEAYKPVKSNHDFVKVTVSDRDVAKVKKIISLFNGDIEDVDSDQVDGGGNKFKGTGDIFIQGDDAGKLGMEIAKSVRTVKVVGEGVELDEKYDLYHKTFSDAMQHAYDYAKKKLGITVDSKEIDSKVATGPKKPSEGKTNKYRLKGKGGNLQIQVYNKGGSKPFELNMYKEENEMTKSLKDTIVDMWSEAVSPAQQAAIAISKKEKEEQDEGNAFGAALQAARENGDETFVVSGKTYKCEDYDEKGQVKETNKNNKSDDGDGMDAVQPKAVKKKFKDRKDKDIDNDGDVDDSDKFLHKRRKAVSKAINSQKESIERYHETKKGSLRDAVLQMWGEKHTPDHKEDEKNEKKSLTKEKKDGSVKKMTDTGKEVTPVETSVKMPKIKETNNKV